MSNKLVGWSALFAAVAVAGLVVVYVPTFVADSLYKNVDDITDGEMPPTVTSFQSGPDVVSTIGGSGDGLNCSIPALANPFFDQSYSSTRKDSDGRPMRHLVLQRFRQACVFHDLCYRHGLATYGYNQNDCDRILQNAAFRLCLYVPNSGETSRSDRCQIDSKMVLAGVSLGGYNSYRAWDESTFFEFESDPWRSQGFLASRVVDNPAKLGTPIPGRKDPDQIILTFENVRSSVAVDCVTCSNTQRRQVWLPPGPRHGAPHSLVDRSGKNSLVWVSRKNRTDSTSCIVMADPATLLAGTLPKNGTCNESAGPSLARMEVDLLATSPLLTEIARPSDRILATSMTAQKDTDRSLRFCSRSAARPTRDDKASCEAFSGAEATFLRQGQGLGAFQNFGVTRPEQQIYFARDIHQRTDSSFREIWQGWWGNTYSPGGNLLVVDIQSPARDDAPAVPKLSVVRFDIADRLDPMMPIRRDANDRRFLSIEKPEFTVGMDLQPIKPVIQVRMFDFASANPARNDVRLTIKGNEIDLHQSWALRPVLVVETRDAVPKTKLVFSRGKIVYSDATSETLGFEILAFERDATSNGSLMKTDAAACTIKYTLQSPDDDKPCERLFDPGRTMRPSPAAIMRSSQLLVGNFAGGTRHGIALTDYCLKKRPVVLKPDGGSFSPADESPVLDTRIKREVKCKSLDDPASISRDIDQRAN